MKPELWANPFLQMERDELKENIKDAIHCHFEKNGPKIVRLHYVKEEVFAA